MAAHNWRHMSARLLAHVAGCINDVPMAKCFDIGNRLFALCNVSRLLAGGFGEEGEIALAHRRVCGLVRTRRSMKKLRRR